MAEEKGPLSHRRLAHGPVFLDVGALVLRKPARLDTKVQQRDRVSDSRAHTHLQIKEHAACRSETDTKMGGYIESEFGFPKGLRPLTPNRRDLPAPLSITSTLIYRPFLSTGPLLS